VGYVPYAIVLLGYLAQTQTDLHTLWNQWRSERIRLLQRSDVSEDFGRIAASFEVSIRDSHMDGPALRLLSLLAILPDGISSHEVAEVFPHLGEAACITLRRLAMVFPKERRLRLHGLLQEYVREKYPPDPDDARLAVEYYARLAVEEEGRFGTKDADKAVSRFAANLGNIEAVIRIALHGEQEPTGVAAAAALAGYAFLTGTGSRELVESTLERQASVAPQVRARLLKNCADLEMRYGRRDRAYQMYAMAHDVCRDLGETGAAADCTKKIADLDREAGKLAEAAAAPRPTSRRLTFRRSWMTSSARQAVLPGSLTSPLRKRTILTRGAILRTRLTCARERKTTPGWPIVGCAWAISASRRMPSRRRPWLFRQRWN
jgi:hypothetical protein